MNQEIEENSIRMQPHAAISLHYPSTAHERRLDARKSMTHCRVPHEPRVRARARNERPLFHSIGRCVRVEKSQRPHTTYTSTVLSTVYKVK
ncbi:hypothetical protein EVAR_82088_1 [Eumeta japonica]|uniref:Uncharacterized protein n=1 Tax=Eumeta variegata TaxID=151549 RepID=A0A4C1U1I7_EUMVA|nr:hypothetical protein EVAR_82088_1 [Eumeta japonica]